MLSIKSERSGQIIWGPDASTETLNLNKIVNFNENIVMKKEQFLYFDEVDQVRYIRSSERTDPSTQNQIDIVILNGA